MTYNACFSTTNVRGLGSELKRREVFLWLKWEKFDVSFLQETHSTLRDEILWQQQWGFSNSILFSHGTTNSCGVAIVIRQGLDFAAERIWRDQDGRCLLVQARIDDLQVILANWYSPNVLSDQIEFFQRMHIVLTIFNEQQLPIIIGGDFNLAFNPELDKRGGTYRPKTTVFNSVREIQVDWTLVDCWRELHPFTREYTWQQPHPLVKCRLDYWLIPADLLGQVVVCKNKTMVFSDHKCVFMRLQGPRFRRRGPGVWRLNSSILQQKEYEKCMEHTVKGAMEETGSWDARLRWEFLKMKVSDESMRYCAGLNSKRVQKRIQLQSTVDSMQHQNDLNAAEDRCFFKAKAELEAMLEEDARRAILRTRLRWLMQGEKPTKYFLGLEKRNAVRKCISKIVTNEKSEITDQKEILTEIQNHFNRIYAKVPITENELKAWFQRVRPFDSKKLSNESRDSLERELEHWEFAKAINEMAQGKAPGRDGLPVEWYRKFWNHVKTPLFDAYRAAFSDGNLARSQTQGIITMIPKPGKEPTNLSNWRPITLLNCDYKILAKALANRLKKYVNEVIHDHQTGFMKGRYIGENVRFILDLIEAVNTDPNGSGILLSLDFEKAFDTISWDFMINGLLEKNIGPQFVSHVRLLYSNPVSEVINNGYITRPIYLERGIRQGCPLSPYLFIIAMDFLTAALSDNDEIQGIKIDAMEYKVCQYADDTTLFLRDKTAAQAALATLDEFGSLSGLKLNKGKTQCLGLGPNWQHIEKPDGLRDVTETRVLGITFAYDNNVMIEQNFSDKLDKVEMLMRDWETRNLTFFGKVLVWNQLLVSHLVYSLMNIPVSSNVLKRMAELIVQFIWNNGSPKIRHEVLLQPLSAGGIKAPDVMVTIFGLRFSWLRRILRDPSATWTKIGFRSFDAIGGLPFLLHCNFDIRLLPIAIPSFYASILDVYRWVRNSPVQEVETAEQLAGQLVCNNRFLIIDGKSIFYEWLKTGSISKVCDWFDINGRPRHWQELSTLVDGALSPLGYCQVISSVPLTWRRMMDQAKEIIVDISIPNPNCVNTAKRNYIESRRTIPAGQLRWAELFPDVSDWEWRRIWTLCTDLALPNKYRQFQFRLLHRILASPSKLFQWKHRQSPACYSCDAEIDNTEHMLVLCPQVSTVWNEIFEYLSNLEGNTPLVRTTENILFGFFQPDLPADTRTRLNTVVILAKHYIYVQRRQESPGISGTAFRFVLERYLLNCWHVAQTSGQLQTFGKLWRAFLPL